MRHLIACRFSVPRLEPESATRHADPEWLESRLALFRAYFAPSVGRLGVPVVLLCSSASAAFVAEKTRQFPWARVEEQDDWRGGPTGFADLVVTRLDSDDALAADWFSAVEMAPEKFEVCVTREFLRLDARGQRRRALYAYRRREPSPLAAFRGDLHPFAHDHATLDRHFACHDIPGSYLLQVAHGGNLSSRAPKWWRFHRRQPIELLRRFGLG